MSYANKCNTQKGTIWYGWFYYIIPFLIIYLNSCNNMIPKVNFNFCSLKFLGGRFCIVN